MMPKQMKKKTAVLCCKGWTTGETQRARRGRLSMESICSKWSFIFLKKKTKLDLDLFLLFIRFLFVFFSHVVVIVFVSWDPVYTVSYQQVNRKQGRLFRFKLVWFGLVW